MLLRTPFRRQIQFRSNNPSRLTLTATEAATF